MQPNDNRQLTVNPRNQQPLHSDRDRAAEVMRQQIDRIYDEPKKSTEKSDGAHTNPYEHTHDNSEGHNASGALATLS